MSKPTPQLGYSGLTKRVYIVISPTHKHDVTEQYKSFKEYEENQAISALQSENEYLKKRLAAAERVIKAMDNGTAAYNPKGWDALDTAMDAWQQLVNQSKPNTDGTNNAG